MRFCCEWLKQCLSEQPFLPALCARVGVGPSVNLSRRLKSSQVTSERLAEFYVGGKIQPAVKRFFFNSRGKEGVHDSSAVSPESGLFFLIDGFWRQCHLPIHSETANNMCSIRPQSRNNTRIFWQDIPPLNSEMLIDGCPDVQRASPPSNHF